MKTYQKPTIETIRTAPAADLLLTLSGTEGEPDGQFSRRRDPVADDAEAAVLGPLPKQRDLWAD